MHRGMFELDLERNINFKFMVDLCYQNVMYVDLA